MMCELLSNNGNCVGSTRGTRYESEEEAEEEAENDDEEETMCPRFFTPRR